MTLQNVLSSSASLRSMLRYRSAFVTFVTLCCVLWCTAAPAQFVDSEAARSSAKKSLSDRAFPWYDAEADTTRTPEVEVYSEPTEEDLDPGNRSSNWVREDTPPTATPATPTMPAWFALVVEIFTWGMLAVIIVVIVGLLVWGFMAAVGHTSPRSKSKRKTIDRTTDVDRVEELPINIQPKSDLLAEARRLFDAGDYAAAAIYLYSYKLMMLDRAQQIRLTRGKTNRQYLREVAVPALRDILQPTMVMFEDAFFGKREIPRGRFDACWNRVETFENLLLSHQSS